MVGSNVNLPEEENTPEKRVERIFNLMDKVSFYLNYSFFMKPATRSDFPLPIIFPTVQNMHCRWRFHRKSREGENQKSSLDPWRGLFERFATLRSLKTLHFRYFSQFSPLNLKTDCRIYNFWSMRWYNL